MMGKQETCEICDEPLKEGELVCGCEKCGNLYGPCCNSVHDGICVECSEG
jgi:hypothetical protein